MHCEKISEEKDDEINITTKSTHLMIFCACKLIQDYAEEYMNGIDDEISLYFAKNELLYYYDSGQDNDNLPVSLYAYIIPDMGHQFIMHVLLSLGIFETELDMKIHRTLSDALRYTKLVGTDCDEELLKQYSRLLRRRFIGEQLVYLQNIYIEIESLIINAAHIFDDVIINGSITITDMPPVLHTAIFESQDEVVVIFWSNTK